MFPGCSVHSRPLPSPKDCRQALSGSARTYTVDLLLNLVPCRHVTVASVCEDRSDEEDGGLDKFNSIQFSKYLASACSCRGLGKLLLLFTGLGGGKGLEKVKTDDTGPFFWKLEGPGHAHTDWVGAGWGLPPPRVRSRAGHGQDPCSAAHSLGDPGLVSCPLGSLLSPPVKWRPWNCPEGQVKRFGV